MQLTLARAPRVNNIKTNLWGGEYIIYGVTNFQISIIIINIYTVKNGVLSQHPMFAA